MNNSEISYLDKVWIRLLEIAFKQPSTECDAALFNEFEIDVSQSSSIDELIIFQKENGGLYARYWQNGGFEKIGVITKIRRDKMREKDVGFTFFLNDGRTRKFLYSGNVKTNIPQHFVDQINMVDGIKVEVKDIQMNIHIWHAMGDYECHILK